MEFSEILAGTPEPEAPASTVETPAPAQQETAPTTTVEQPAVVPRDERGRFARQEEPQLVEQPPHEERQQHTVPVSALIEERRKRQELEARLAVQQPQTPQVKDEEFWQSPVQATQQIVGQTAQNFQAQILNMKYELAEDMTRTLHTDYDTVRNGFIAKVAEGNPWAVAIAQQMGAQANPAKFVYDQAKKLAALDEVGDLQSYEARIRADERARVMAETQRQGRPVPEVPRSLNSEPSAAVPSSPQAFEMTPLSNIIGGTF